LAILSTTVGHTAQSGKDARGARAGEPPSAGTTAILLTCATVGIRLNLGALVAVQVPSLLGLERITAADRSACSS
jgi:hypothetical protein